MGAQAGDAVVGDKGCVLVARTIEGLLDKIYFTSGSEAEKGSRFEKLIVAYLQTAGQYAGRFSDVRLWQDWEGRQGEADTGIDIVATDKLTGELLSLIHISEPTRRTPISY